MMQQFYFQQIDQRRLSLRPGLLIICFLFFVSGMNIPLFSQDKIKLSITDLPQLVKNKSTSVQSKALDVRIKELDIKNQPFIFFPSLSFAYKGELNNLFGEDFFYKHTLGFSSGWSLSDAQFFAQAAERLEFSQLKDEYELLYQDELYEVLLLYIDTLKKKDVYALEQTKVEASQFQFNLAQSKKVQGLLSEIDLINSEADRDNAHYLAEKAKLDFDIALSRLSRRLGFETAAQDTLELTDNPTWQNTTLSLDNIQEYKNEQGEFFSLTINKLKKSLSVLQMERVVALRDRWLPDLSVNLGLTYTPFYYNSLTAASAVTRPANEPEWTTKLTISASIPIFERNEKTNAIRKNQLALSKAQLALRQAKEDLLGRFQELIESCNRSIDLLAISQKRVMSASRQYEKKQESFKLGIANTLEIYEVRNQYLDTQKDFLFLQFEILRLKAELGNLLGDTLFLLL